MYWESGIDKITQYPNKKQNMKTFYTSLVLACLLTVNTIEAQAQQRFPYPESEYRFYLTGGASKLKYSLAKDGETKGGVGLGVGADYICHVSSVLGFSMGFELSSFRGKAEYKSLTETYEALDDQGTRMDYTYSIDDYLEKQNMTLLSVPVMVRFTIPSGKRSNFYLAGGMKFGFPVISKTTISGSNIIATGYYRHENLTYSNLPEHGFFSGQSASNEISHIKGFTTMTSLTAEAGMRFNVSKLTLYTGLYFDYCLNTSDNSRNKHPVNYFREVNYESVLNSPLSSKPNLMNIGVKVGIGMF